MAQNQPTNAKYFYTHLEVGYTTEWGEHVLPNPEWSGPSNNRTLDETDSKVSPGLVDKTATEVLEILEHNRAKGVFLAFPYFAEKHPAIMKAAVAAGHLFGIHMHENWKALTAQNEADKITGYIKAEKTKLDTAVGAQSNIFSYGPGIQFDEMGGKERPPNYGSLTDDEKRKLFQAISGAGFTLIQTAREYQPFLPAELKSVDTLGEFIGIPHSFEWHTQRSQIRQAIDQIKDRTQTH
jgi:hypothetical protein